MALVDPGRHDGDSSSDEDLAGDLVDRIARASIDMARFGLPQDARKRTEMQPTANDLAPAARRSMEMVRKSMEGKGPSPSGKPVIMADEPSDDDEGGSTATPRKSLEEQLGGDDEASLLKSFPKSTGLSSEEADRLLKQFGENTLPENITPPWLVFARLLFWQPMPVIIWVCLIIEFAIINYIDGIILMCIVVGNASLSFYELQKAGNAVAALKQNMKPKAICKRDGTWNHEFPANLLVPGDLVELAAGNAVPADVMINDGNVEVDESAMTGETEPVSLTERTMAKMGGSIVRGECEATVVHTGGNTFFGRTAAMLGGESVSNLQQLLQNLLYILVFAACTLSLISLIYLAATGHTVHQFLDFAVVLIVASVPLAMEIVTNTTLALGSRQLTAYGAIVSRLTSIEDLAGMNMLCSDKTGTLTKNKMEIQPDAPTFMPNLTQMDLLRYAAMAARWDSPPKDALDTLVLRCHLWVPGLFDAKEQHRKANPGLSLQELDEWANSQVEARLMEGMADFERLDHMPFDPTVKRTESTVRIKSTGQIIKVTKGAPHIITALDSDEEKHAEVEEVVRGYGEDGVRCMAIAVSDPLPGYDPENTADVHPTFHLAGILTFLDPPRLDTKDTISRAQRYGVPVKMITGDHLLIAKKTAKDLDMGDKAHPDWPNIQGPSGLPLLIDGKAPKNLLTEYGDLIRDADGFAQVYPEHKFLIVETYRGLGYKTGMTGDGVNDAPALKAADVGIAVAGATEAARAAADIVLTEEGLGTIVYAMEIARVIFRRMKAFITYRIAASLYILLTFFIALFAFRPPLYLPHPPPIAAHPAEWEDYFQLPVLFLIFITVFNDGCIISIGYDRAVASQIPERWLLPALWVVAGALAFVACLGTLIFIFCCVDSWSPDGIFQLWDIGGLQYGQIMCAVYLQTSIAAFLTLFSARTQSDPWYTTAPHPLLGFAAALALTLSNIIALAWGPDTLSEIPILGLAWYAPQLLILWIWIYTVFIFILQDLFKLLVFKIIIRYNLFNFVHDDLMNPALIASANEVPLVEVAK